MSRKWIVGALAFITATALTAYVTTMALKPKPGGGKPSNGELSKRQAIPVPTVKFTDITEEAGIKFQHINGATGKKILPETMGGGVAIFDFDGDGKQDILMIQSGLLPGHNSTSPLPTMALYRNLGGNKFEDVTKAVGLDVPMYGMGVCVGDIDNDGWPDIFISCIGKHHLFRNVNGKKFEEISATSGVAGEVDLPWTETREKFVEWFKEIPFGSSCTFVDYDGDGKLDLFVCHYIEWSPKTDRNVSASLAGLGRAYVPPRDFNGTHCKLFRNLGGNKFQDVSLDAGIRVFRSEGTDVSARQRPVGKCLGVIICDPDHDGWPDLIVANDGTPNFFFHNVPDPKTGGRKYQEDGIMCGVGLPDDGTARGGMGIDYAEIMPGVFAAVIANFANEPNTLLRLRVPEPGGATEILFNDVALTFGLAGLSRNPLKFGATFFDYDLDGRLDLLTCNGHIEPDIDRTQSGQKFAQSAQLFWNTGIDKPIFEEVKEASAGKDLFKPIVGRGSAFGDLDGDGDLDAVLVNNNGPPIVLRNDCELKNHWLRLTLVGDGKRSNTSAIGAVVTVEVGGRKLVRTVLSGRGYLSQSELPLTFGLAESEKIDRIFIQWPGKEMHSEEFTDLTIDKGHTIKQGTGRVVK